MSPRKCATTTTTTVTSSISSVKCSSRHVHWNPLLVQLFRTTEHLNSLSLLLSRMAKLFYSHGKFCASHPWEVMVTFLSLAICMFTMGPYILLDNYHHHHHHTQHTATSALAHPYLKSPHYEHHHLPAHSYFETFTSSKSDSQSAVYHDCSSRRNVFTENSRPHQSGHGIDSSEVVILTISRCLALLYVYHQFRNLYKLGSKYLVGIAGLFTVFSSFVFCSGVINFLNGNLTVLNKALPYFILLSDFSKASLLAQFALSSSNREEVHENIARGMATLGPSLTLDTLVETLAIGMGSISGLPRLAEISYFSCMTILVNYAVFMTFFPAALSLALELAHDHETVEAPVWQFASLAKVLQLETEHTPNPVIQRVKLVMSAGLMLVHGLSRWPSYSAAADSSNATLDSFESNPTSMAKSDSGSGQFGSFTSQYLSSTGTEQILMIGLVCALAIKYIFFENKDIYNRNIVRSNSYSNGKYKQYHKNEQQQSSKQHLLNKDDGEMSSSVSETSSSTPSSTRPTTPTISSTSDELDSSRASKSTTPSILITNQDSDTESVIAEFRRKISENRMLMSSASTSTSSSRANSVKGLCVTHRAHHHTSSSGHGTDNDSASLPASECEVPDHTQSPSFFIGDDCCSECYSSDSSTEYVDREVQTDISWEDYKNACLEAVATVHESHQPETGEEVSVNDEEPLRDLDTLLLLLKKEEGCSQMSDREVQFLVEKQHIPAYKLESVLGNPQRGVAIRRRVIESYAARPGVLHEVPYLAYNYDIVLGACCENVIGYLPLPLGVAGPLLLNGRKYFVPMATTEGCLVASTNRGCRAVSLAGGLRAKVFADGMTRGPVLHFRSAMEAADAMEWLNVPQNFELIKSVFDSTSRFARLQKIHPRVAGRYLYVRFVASTGDAMGMNMLSKGTELALEELSKHVTGIEMKCLSGNFCTDKKPSSVNWIEGRGKSVVCETIVPRSIVEKVLKTSVDALVELNISKNLIGSSVAGSIGGNNAQAANIVAAIYIATGQDPAQTVGSSNCLTIMEAYGEDLYVSCTMPSIEIGTIGGGTVLGPQGACLQLLGLKGCSATKPGSNSSELAQVVCGTVLAAELSLLSALAAGHLVRSHMKHNRSNININLEAAPSSLLNTGAK